MLVKLASITDRLSCPRCASSLRSDDGGLFCSDTGCPLSQAAFPVAGNQPVLVDFDNSILEQDAVVASGAASTVKRRPSRFTARLRAILFGENGVAAENERQLIELSRQIADRPTIVVVGGGTIGSGVSAMYARQDVDVVAFDIYASDMTSFVADAHRIPLRDESADAVWIQAVLEHVLTPSDVVAEIHRVLRPHGVVYSETPFVQQVHEAGYDFSRFTHSGHRWLFRRFEEINSGVVAGAGTQLLWSIDHFFRSTFHSRAAGALAKLLFWPLRLFDRVGDDKHVVNGASCFFFLGRKSTTALKAHDMPAYYRGPHQG